LMENCASGIGAAGFLGMIDVKPEEWR
jgi:hypothetical protein